VDRTPRESPDRPLPYHPHQPPPSQAGLTRRIRLMRRKWAAIVTRILRISHFLRTIPRCCTPACTRWSRGGKSRLLVLHAGAASSAWARFPLMEGVLVHADPQSLAMGLLWLL